MSEYPPGISRRISRLRWTAGILCLFWLIVAIGFYRLHQHLPQTALAMQVTGGIAVVLGIGVIWFIYLVYRIGEVADLGEADGDGGSAGRP